MSEAPHSLRARPHELVGVHRTSLESPMRHSVMTMAADADVEVIYEDGQTDMALRLDASTVEAARGSGSLQAPVEH